MYQEKQKKILSRKP